MFLASKAEWEIVTKMSVLQSSKNRKIRENGFFRFPGFLLLCRTDAIVIISWSVFDAENDGEESVLFYAESLLNKALRAHRQFAQ